MAAVTATLTADVAGYIAAMNRAAAATNSFATKATSAGAKAAASTKSFADKSLASVGRHKDSINTISNGLGLFGAAVGLGVGAAVRAFANFDAAMSNVAATGADARQNLSALKDAAIQAGAATQFSATEAAQGEEALAKAGVSAKDVLGGGLKGALDLAAAGQIGVADAAETAATAMTQFNLTGKDVPHIADLLAAGAGKAQGEVSDMAQALKQSGLVASQFGLSIEDTTGTLAAFASAGLIGSDAGTSFKTMLLKLAQPSKQAADTMKKLGINAYDAQGQFVGVTDLAGQLQSKLGGLTQAQRNAALATIFGTDAIRAANVLYTQGSSGIQDWIGKVNDTGYAAKTAATKMDNLKGDLEQLKGSFETALIGLGEGANGPLRGLIQDATSAVNAFNNLGAGTKSATLVVAASVAGIALAAAGIGKIVVFAAEARGALVALGITAEGTAGSMRVLASAALPAGAALAAVAGGAAALDRMSSQVSSVNELAAALGKIGAGSSDLSGLYTKGNWADALMGSLTGSVEQADNLTGAITALAVASQGNTFQKFASSFETLKEGITPGTQGLEKMKEQVSNVDQALAQMVSGGNLAGASAAFGRIAAQAKAQGVDVATLTALFPQYKAALEGAGSASSAAAAGSQAAGTAAEQHAAAVQLEAQAFDDMITKAYAASDALLQMSGSQIGVESAIDAATKAAKDNGKTLNLNTAKGRANQQALNSLASATTQYTQELIKSGASADTVVAANERGRKSFIKTARDMGKTKAEATALANSLFALPAEIKSQVVVSGGKVSAREAKDLNKALKDIPKEQRAKIVTIAETKGAKAAKAAIEAVKDKTVIATSKGDLKGAKAVDAAMKALRDRLVKAISRGDKKGANDVKAAMAALRDKNVYARSHYDGSGVRAARSDLNSIDGKTATTYVKTVHVGGAKPKASATGGYITGPGTGTSDDIPAMLSNGEFVIRAAAVNAYGLDNLHAINAMGYKDGGLVGFAAGGQVDVARIFRMIAQLVTPLSAVRSADAALTAARAAKAKEDRDVAAARAQQKRARSKKQKSAAKSNLTKQLDEQKTAQQKLTDSTRALSDAQNAAADSARTVSDQFASAFRSASTDAKDWVGSMQQGAGDLTAFAAQITSLRKQGLSETLIQQLIGQGAAQGGEAAGSILAGGKGLINQLNASNSALQKAADALGYIAALTPQRKALGGPISGPGTGTSDSVMIAASNGEYVVNSAAASAHRSLLDSINYGRNVVSNNYARPGHYRYGGAVSRGLSTGDLRSALSGMRIAGQLSVHQDRGYLEGVVVDVMDRETSLATTRI